MLSRLAFFGSLLALIGTPASTVAAEYSEDAVKAAFLHRFAAYVEWPPASTDADFVIGIVGAEGVASELERLLPGRRIQNRPAGVRRLTAPSELDGVHILYLGRGAPAGARRFIAAAAHRPILIVTDDVDGLEAGAIINFVQVGRRIRLEVSLPAADRSGLRIQSGLLSVAKRVIDRPQALMGCIERPFAREIPACPPDFARRARRGPDRRQAGNSRGQT